MSRIRNTAFIKAVTNVVKKMFKQQTVPLLQLSMWLYCLRLLTRQLSLITSDVYYMRTFVFAKILLRTISRKLYLWISSFQNLVKKLNITKWTAVYNYKPYLSFFKKFSSPLTQGNSGREPTTVYFFYLLIMLSKILYEVTDTVDTQFWIRLIDLTDLWAKSQCPLLHLVQTVSYGLKTNRK